ncbi:MAG: hypothetical protein CO030_05165 [Candidatus Magasanikbacteria bacterium CG_4_9_14_0_2_um_filter_42_11]|uniref:NAD-dependent epimerase/dehydratase domain-containing protein n=1 Tax=Candidatus Magasanikbacteria bacterium CG_4_9_14_0_2_um_filter_42_11 TaxID=1974643 RepID=A0A2M8F8D5_9BACT|nr:MAG: hypothetical protein COU34_00675 [Candidatus Magasanikbacteria bacterium CG10_big_fil_rev_8_21_14_0_10_43_9]PIY92202.1 MAG: hypothetical protein COY70_04540 [Candidatus Magasanikbacteria bacterium CG_4_10_14_0_8_um_filter_42_12]PJC51993.1 MAG: hypothetical protein CO030_05165 [Candidatus Magasanikbacteria bacterium CG_4_9_14_0_2_um_filter_42_11]
MARCLVTGGAGFIGSHLTDQLLADGHEVIVIDSLLLGKREFVNEKASFQEMDIREFSKMLPLCNGIDVIFHLAADPRLPLSIEDPQETHAVNVTGTLNVLDAARQAGVKKVIITSSAAVYGDEPLPISEDMVPRPKSPYGMHKHMDEQYARLFHDLYGLETVSLRYFNVYGPRKLANGGYPMVIPVFLEQQKKGQPLTITGDGNQTRDYVHVSDVVRANILAWQSDVHSGEPINIANGVQTSVNEIATLIGGEKTYISERKGEVRFMQANISKAKELLGWEPTVELADGIAELKKTWNIA